MRERKRERERCIALLSQFLIGHLKFPSHPTTSLISPIKGRVGATKMTHPKSLGSLFHHNYLDKFTCSFSWTLCDLEFPFCWWHVSKSHKTYFRGGDTLGITVQENPKNWIYGFDLLGNYHQTVSRDLIQLGWIVLKTACRNIIPFGQT